MPVSETKRRNNDKYNAKCDRITVWPIKAKGAAIRAAAKENGESLQGYILAAVYARMEREGKPLEIDPDGAPPAPAVTLERRQRERCQR